MQEDQLLDGVKIAVDKWKGFCTAKGENPMCVCHFASLNSKKGQYETRWIIYGEVEETIDFLAETSRHLDPNAGLVPLLENLEKQQPKKKVKDAIVTFKHNKNNMFISSQRRTGESEKDHSRRIEWMKETMIKESDKMHKDKGRK